MSGNTHGNFQDVVCPGKKIASIDDPCPNISSDGNAVILRTTSNHSIVLPMLAAIDFAIIPRSSVDPKTLKIIDMKETSGPYYVAADDGLGHIDLKVNPHHYHASSSIPQRIQLIPFLNPKEGETLRALSSGEVDHISTIDSARSDEVLSFAKDHPDFDLFTTHKIQLVALTFTSEGLRKLSSSERRLLGLKVREVFKDVFFHTPGAEERDEFFPGLGDGSLDNDQRVSLAAINRDVALNLPKHLQVGIIKRSSFESWSIPLEKAIPNAEFYLESDVPDLKKNADNIPDAFIASMDIGFMEDIGLISYSLNAGLLGLKKSERQSWLAKYMSIEEKPDRMKMLRELHFNALASPVIVPLAATPYTALVRKPWKMELSELYANNQLWRIKHQ